MVPAEVIGPPETVRPVGTEIFTLVTALEIPPSPSVEVATRSYPPLVLPKRI